MHYVVSSVTQLWESRVSRRDDLRMRKYLTFDSQMAEKRPSSSRNAAPQSHAARFQDLDPTLQLRIRRTLITCGVWFGLVIASAGLFVLSKPHMDRRREERLTSGVKPRATPNPTAPYAQSSRNKSSRTDN